MSSFSLRPVADNSPSPSPTNSISPPTHSPPPIQSMVTTSPLSKHSGVLLRRPLSPSSLRGSIVLPGSIEDSFSKTFFLSDTDVDLNHTSELPARKYAAPLTGHDLMAMFPAAPPDSFPEMRAGPTSGYFQRQERAFFAQAGKEIVRVRLEIDLQNSSELENIGPSKRSRGEGRPSWSPSGAPHHSPHSSISSQAPPPTLYAQPPPPFPRQPPPRGSVSAAAPLYPITGQSSPSQATNPHAPRLRTPPNDIAQPGALKHEYPPDEYDDDAWRRPMPYAERRRAGKHTRRVIVR